MIMSRRQLDQFVDAFQKELQPHILGLADRLHQFAQHYGETSETFQTFQDHVRERFGHADLKLDPPALSLEGVPTLLPDLLRLQDLSRHCEPLQSQRFYLALYKACRDDLPIIRNQKPTWWRQCLSAFFAILPFLYRLPPTLRVVSRSSCLVRAFAIASFYSEHVIQPWISHMETSLYSRMAEEVQKPRRALEGAMLEKVAEWDRERSTLRFLLSLRGNLSAVPALTDD
jgi:hypothetical protein